jgi:agmatine deiminase
MPPESAPHQATLMAWPTRADLWREYLDEAKHDYAEVARAIAAFEPVVMVCEPGSAGEVHDRCGAGIEPLEMPIDDSWMRDNGPVFVANERGEIALVHFGFNAWGEKYHPYDKDAEVPKRLGAHLGCRLYQAPFVLEGGSYFVDGERTVLTTEECLLNRNRNPSLDRAGIEDGLRTFLGVRAVVWLPFGMAEDRDTDGHVDGVAQFVEPGRIALMVPSDDANPNAERARANLEALGRQLDARGRTIAAEPVDGVAYVPRAGRSVPLSYMNLYLCNGAAIVPVAGIPEDERALADLAAIWPDREIVPVPGVVISLGGGGPHCITQQVPAGTFVP